MPRGLSEISNESLIILAEQGMGEACYERLIRDVMAVDNLEYMEAKAKAHDIKVFNRKHNMRYGAMNWLGMGFSSVCLVGCVPMVFSKSCALWFNQRFVTTDVPPPEDLETFWEVGSWTWNWMEPALGTGSFMLLCVQLFRAQLVNMNYEPWTAAIRTKRAEHLCAAYPQYTDDIVWDFAATSSLRRKKTSKKQDH